MPAAPLIAIQKSYPSLVEPFFFDPNSEFIPAVFLAAFFLASMALFVKEGFLLDLCSNNDLYITKRAQPGINWDLKPRDRLGITSGSIR